MSITASEARQRLFPLIEQVNDDQAAVEVVSKRGTAYLVPADEYHSLLETVHLLRSPANAERLRASITQAHARAGRAAERPSGRAAERTLLDAGTSDIPVEPPA